MEVTSKLLLVIEPRLKRTAECHDSDSCRRRRIESPIPGMCNIKGKVDGQGKRAQTHDSRHEETRAVESVIVILDIRKIVVPGIHQL